MASHLDKNILPQNFIASLGTPSDENKKTSVSKKSQFVLSYRELETV